MKRNNMRFKSIICLESLAVLFIFVLFGCARRDVRNADSQGKNIICFGDSITFGYGVNSGQSYPDFLRKMVDMPVINAGEDGDTTIKALGRIGKDVLEKNPYMVIIEFSGNDFLRKIPKEVTLENISKMVDLVQENNAIAAIVDISANFFLADYRKELNRLAYEKKAIFIPHVLSGIITNPNMKSDFLHPNAAGYKLIAFQISQAIKPYLKKLNSAGGGS